MSRACRPPLVLLCALTSVTPVHAGPKATAPDPRFELRLGEETFDPAIARPQPHEPAATAAPENDLQLVQLQGPIQQAWLDHLERGGLEVIQYIHPYTYVVWGNLARSRAATAASFVRWAGPFRPDDRLLPRFRALDRSEIAARALAYRGADRRGLLAALEAAGARLAGSRVIDHRFEIHTFAIAGSELSRVASIPGIYSVRPLPTDGGLRGEMSDQVNAGNVDGTNLAFPGYPSWLASVGLSGAGVRIANVDGGVQETHPDLAARFVACTGTTCSSTSSSHGTHTAGIMAADGASGTLDSRGFLRGLGMAPGATLVEQVYSPHYLSPGGMLLLMKDSAANGAELSGNSWGPSGSPLGYDDDTMQVDLGVRDADSSHAGNQPFTFVLSFMNGNGGVSSQGTPDEAKNLFNVGSTKMQLSGTGAQILAIDDLSANSAHGPALDGRTIPHLVAPGCSVDSTVTGSTYSLLCGTSMASPHVSGAVALFFEYYRGLFATDPSPALVKAAFLPVAHDLAGHLDADGGVLGHPFDSKQGWGRMNLPAVVDPAVEVAYFDNPRVFDNTGESWTRTLTVPDTTAPVRLMLVWTDAPGHGLGGSTPAWNNDLDLEVTVGANTYLGNVFGASGLSIPGGTADFKNNTEGVFLPAGTTSITVRVEAANLTSDGIPGSGDATDQDFALVCYNCLAGIPIFADGFETGDSSAWTVTVP